MKNQPIEAPSEHIERAVRKAGSLSIDCELCGRVHFATLETGPYDEGELERLRAKAKKEPDKYLEDPSYDSISWGKIDGKQAVIGCPCKGLRKYEDFLWSNRYAILTYLELRSKDRLDAAKMDAEAVDATKKALR